MERIKLLMIRATLGDAGFGVPAVRQGSSGAPEGVLAKSCLSGLSGSPGSPSGLMVTELGSGQKGVVKDRRAGAPPRSGAG